MQEKNVQIRLILTIMILVVLWGINTSALVINQWMAKAAVPQILGMENKPRGLEVELLGYHLNWWEVEGILVKTQGRGMQMLSKVEAGIEQVVIPKVKDFSRQLNSDYRILFDESSAYWQRIQGKFFFKDS